MIEHIRGAWSAYCDECGEPANIERIDFGNFTAALLAAGWRLDKWGRGTWLTTCAGCNREDITREAWEASWRY